MRRLPPHHVPRPRLTDRCGTYHVIVVEAAAGYGKSVLAAELVEHWRTVGIDVQLEHGDVPATLLAARLRAGVQRAGFTEAAGAGADAGQDATGAVDAMMGALAAESCAIVIDDAHFARTDAGQLIDRMAGRLEGDQRLVVLARQLPEGASRLRRADYLQLTSADLALEPQETLELCRAGFGLKVTAEVALALDRSTGGWTAATVLAAARAARTGESLGSVARWAPGPGHPSGAVAAILDDAIVALGPGGRPLLAQVARLPLLDPELVGAASGDEDLFERGLRAGIPFTPARGPWWDLPGPVRDYMATFGPLDADAIRRAARVYARRGELGSALQLLLASGDADEAASLLAEAPPHVVELMDALEVRAVFAELPTRAVDAHPWALMVAAGNFQLAGDWEQLMGVCQRALHIAEQHGDKALARAASAELASKLNFDLKRDAAVAAARDVLAAAEADEQQTRARAYHMLGQALCWRVDASGRRDEAALAEAAECFERASNLYRKLGMRSAFSSVAVYWAMTIEFPQGQAAPAMARLDEALALASDRLRRWGYVMCFRAWVATELGLDDVCHASAEEALRVAEQINSDVFRAHGHWKLAILASYRGDAEETLYRLRQVELHKEKWWAPGSGDFLAEAADLLDRVGHTALAREYLARVKAEPKDADHLAALAEAAIEARHGDPVLAEERLLVAGQKRIDPREYWRVTLLKAFAAFRRGEDATAGALAAQAFEQAARLGQPQLPMIRERAVTEQLLGLAVGTGQPAAIALEASSLPMSLALLGRFELTVAGRPVPLSAGQEARLLKFVAVSGGRAHAEQAIETMWPETGRAAGRHRLRTVLNRLRAAAGNVMYRDGEMLATDDALWVDLHHFLSEAHRAQALASTDLALATGIAKGAMATYRGELLPEDRYEDWAERPRQQAQVVMLDLLDLCASEAAQRGDLDGLRRIVERTIEFAPYDDLRYLRAASTLLQQGRRGEALSVVHRARSAFAEIGMEPPGPLLDLERSIVA